MTADDSSCGPWNVGDLKKMLLGSGKKWRSRCEKTAPHVLIIEPTVDCRGEDWMVQSLAFDVKNVKKVEVYIDDVYIFSVSCCI